MSSPHKKVIVLGAGASKPAGVPLINEFLLEGMQEAFADRWDELKPLNEFWRKTQGSDLYPRPNIEGGIPYHSISPGNAAAIQRTDIERVLEQAEMLAERGELDPSVPEGIKQFVFRVIASRANISSRGANTYAGLIDRDIAPRTGHLTIISFNYDTLLERFMLPRALASCFSYRLPDPFKENFGSYERDDDRTFDYLKLHGSLNWLRCPNCEKFSIRWAGTYRDDSELGKCPECCKRRERVLIPPGKGKNWHLKAIRSIWALAATSLSQADEIVIIGFSFRPADAAACTLFSNNLRSDRRLCLTIVDKQHERISRRLKDLGIPDKTLNRAQCVESFEAYTQMVKT